MRRSSPRHHAELQTRIAALRGIDWERELRDPSGDTSRLSFFSGFCLGLVVGIVVAVLLAPDDDRA
jgi:hypothetical protein